MKKAASILALLAASQAFGAPIVTAPFAGNYTIVDLGAPANVPTNYGGINFLAGDPNTLLLAGNSNSANGVIDTLGLVRDANGHITGFAPTANFYANAPENDGGLAYAPNGTLLFTRYDNNQIGQIKPGSTSADLIVNAPAALNSLGTLNFVPAGYNGEGNLILGSYNNATFCVAPMTDNGNGTYGIGNCTHSVDIGSGGPEGIIYVPQGSAGFANQSVLISLYSSGIVASYEIDANGLPVVGSRRDFITGLNNVEGAVVDPLTGDFLFTTYGGGNHVYQVQGFANPTPEPATLAMLGAGLAAVGLLRRRKS